MTTYDTFNESLSYELQKGIIKREINWGNENYAANRAYFKKDKTEKALLYNLKHQYREKMRNKFPDWTRRTSGRKKYLETVYKHTF